MMKHARPALRILATASLLLLAACKHDAGNGNEAAMPQGGTPIVPQLIPMPAVLQQNEGSYAVDASTPLHASGAEAQRVAHQFDTYLADAKRPLPKIDNDANANDGIRFAIDASASKSAEGYVLDVTKNGVQVRASSEAGLFHGAVTLWQLLTESTGKQTLLPALHIEDAPRFAWRGLMLDSARHFQSVAQIKQLLDAMALHKLDELHWHLTDDQGWRVEIKRYPLLTGIGDCRVDAGDAGLGDGGQPLPHCEFYTQDEVRDVVAYAAARHIEVVPEFDIPGHATAAITAYPELGTAPGKLQVGHDWGVYANLLNNEQSTFDFLDNVYAELIDLFPGRYIHIGGDEAVKDQWIASPRVQQRMKELGAKDETAMQALFVAHLEQFLVAHDKKLIGWDEILEGPLPSDATVMSWRGTDGGLAAANAGHDVVMSPAPTLYFDHPQFDADTAPGQPGVQTLKSVYDYEPVPDTLAADKQAHIIGVQANVWTEHKRTFAQLQDALFPRLAALAETGWSPRDRKDFADFGERLPAMLQRYDALGLLYAKDAPAKPLDATTRNSMQLDDCNAALRWHLEDDGPRDGERDVYAVNIFKPCWLWKQADLNGVANIEVRAGRIPYNFQLAHDEAQRKFEPAVSAHGELVIRAQCNGPRLASVPLPENPDSDGFVTLKAAIPTQSTATDVCAYFTGDTRPNMWVLSKLTLAK